MNTRKTGTEYEQIAAEYLLSHGVAIVERNYRNRRGEIDIIGKDGDYTVFIEVKYRKDSAAGQPAEAVNYGKQRKICKVADYYRMIHHMGDFTPVRYDVVAVCGSEITWYQNAFEHIYS
ncbi:MAG: YraN family protein [Lachnospiraceae bacterium]|nr:YraN family protein [Lachnospiraceae bacterium]MDE7183167.1 YraN family protein [Lachnospiraceae bacterium]